MQCLQRLIAGLRPFRSRSESRRDRVSQSFSSGFVLRTSSDNRPDYLGKLCIDFTRAAKKNDHQLACQLFQQYLQRGGEPKTWHYNTLIHMFAKRREVKLALKQYELLKARGLNPDIVTLGSLLNACAKAAPPPYDLPVEYADIARSLFHELTSMGISPNTVAYNSLMDSQAKAGLLPKVVEAYQQLLRAQLQPDLVTFNVLMNAYGRGGRPMKALEVVEELMPKAKLKPDIVTWNTLLGAFAKAGHMDGAYQVWSMMKQRDVIPDVITERHLSDAFANNPLMAADLVAECREVSDILSAYQKYASNKPQLPSWLALLGFRHDPRHYTKIFTGKGMLRVHAQRPVSQDDRPYVGNRVDLNKLMYLDLHGMSQSTARMLLLRRLLRFWVLSTRELEQLGLSNERQSWGAGSGAGLEGLGRGRDAGADRATSESGDGAAAARSGASSSNSMTGAGGLREEQGSPEVKVGDEVGKLWAAIGRRTLVVVTGLGRHSAAGKIPVPAGVGPGPGEGSILRQVVQEVLDAEGVAFSWDGRRGRVEVRGQELQRYLVDRFGREKRSSLFHAVGLRYAIACGSLGSLVAAFFVIPKLL